MKLYSTLSRDLEELPAPPGPIRMYFCGPTVYQRAHIGNARPFVIGMWLRSWLRAQGYDAKLVHNITDVNDKIYDAAPGASAELAARATSGISRTRAISGSGCRTCCRRRPRASTRSSRSSPRSSTPGMRIR